MPSGTRVGQKITIGVRPEHLKLAGSGIEAKVRVVEPTGSEIHVVLQSEAQEITAVFRDRHKLVPGDVVALGLDPDQIHLFDGDTGDRLD